MIRQTLTGWYRMGRPRVPPFPPYIIMTSRDADGTMYALTQTGSVGSLNFSISTTLPNRHISQTVYGPYEGPFLQHPDGRTVRLLIKPTGAFAVNSFQGEFIDEKVATRRVLTRDGYKRTVIEVTVPEGWGIGDDLTYTEIDVTD